MRECARTCACKCIYLAPVCVNITRLTLAAPQVTSSGADSGEPGRMTGSFGTLKLGCSAINSSFARPPVPIPCRTRCAGEEKVARAQEARLRGQIVVYGARGGPRPSEIDAREYQIFEAPPARRRGIEFQIYLDIPRVNAGPARYLLCSLESESLSTLQRRIRVPGGREHFNI